MTDSPLIAFKGIEIPLKEVEETLLQHGYLPLIFHKDQMPKLSPRRLKEATEGLKQRCLDYLHEVPLALFGKNEVIVDTMTDIPYRVVGTPDQYFMQGSPVYILTRHDVIAKYNIELQQDIEYGTRFISKAKLPEDDEDE